MTDPNQTIEFPSTDHAEYLSTLTREERIAEGEERVEARSFNDLPEALKGPIAEDSFSLALDATDHVGVIEITCCYDAEKKQVTVPEVERLIARADTYVEYVPRCDGVRIIGVAYGKSVELDLMCIVEDAADCSMSIYRNCDRWVDVSGIPIVDKELGNVDRLIDGLVSDTKSALVL
jgi:hypothetical protein